MDDYRNPVKDLILGKDNVNKFLKVIGNTYADLMIIKGLNLRTSFGVDYRGSYYRAVDKNGVKQTVRAVMKVQLCPQRSDSFSGIPVDQPDQL